MSSKKVENGGTRFVWKIENFSNSKGESIRSPEFTSWIYKWCVKIYPEECQDIDSPFKLELKNVVNTAKVKRHCVLIELFSPGMVAYRSSFTFAVSDSEDFPLIWEEKKDQQVCLNFPGWADRSKFYFLIDEDIFGSRKSIFLPNDILTLDIIIWKTDKDLVSPSELLASTQFSPEAVTVKKSFTWQVPGISSFSFGQVKEYKLDFENKKIITAQLSLANNTNFELKLLVPFSGTINCKVCFSDTRGQLKSIGKTETKTTAATSCASIPLNLSKTILISYPKQFLFEDTLKLHLDCEISSQVNFSCVEDKPNKPSLSKVLP